MYEYIQPTAPMYVCVSVCVFVCVLQIDLYDLYVFLL